MLQEKHAQISQLSAKRPQRKELNAVRIAGPMESRFREKLSNGRRHADVYASSIGVRSGSMTKHEMMQRGM